MWTERADALSIFRKWADESTVVCGGLSLGVGSTSIEGTIFSLTDDLVIVRSDNGLSELRVDLSLAVAFGYEDTRRLPAMSAEFDSGLVVFFDDPEVENPELATFVEVRAERRVAD